RSGLIGLNVCPSSSVWKMTLLPTYIRRGLPGEITIGNVHWKRYLASAASWPIGLLGHGFTSRSKPFLMFFLVSKPPYEPANTTSGVSGTTAMYPLSPPPTSYQSVISMPPAFRLGPHSVELSCCAPQTRYGK